MTQQEIISQIKSFPILKQFEIVEAIQNNIKENLNLKSFESEKTEISVDEKLMLVERLGGALKMSNPPMNEEEERKAIEEYLAEKNK